MSRGRRFFRHGYIRANVTGVMTLLITLCQLIVPAVFMGALRLFGADTAADFWGLSSASFLLLYLLMYILMMGVPLWLCTWFLLPRNVRHPSPLMLSTDRRISVVMLCVALCMLANILAAMFSGLLYTAGVPEPPMPQLGDGSVLTLLFDLVVFALVPAVLEEYLLRGVVLETLRPLGNGLAVGVSALLFGLMHGNITQAPYAFLIGLIFGAIYVYTDDLRLCVLVHAIANALSVIVSFLIHYSSAQTAIFWELVILTVVMMTGGVASLWLWRHPLGRSRQKPAASLRARREALFKAPLLWLSVGVMLLILLLRAV